MSSMRRSIRRSMAKKEGTFEPQKPLRDRKQVTVRDLLVGMIRRRKQERLAKEAN